MIFERIWAMPSAQTFSILPIAALLHRYLEDQQVIIDPFARDAEFGTLTNDLNPKTEATRHMQAEDFCTFLLGREPRVVADAVLFDPPYSPRQITECYQQIGKKATQKDTQNAGMYKRVHDGLDKLLKPGGIAISCGWNSNGFGKGRGYKIIEILLVAHGGAHNDTIVTIERKTDEVQGHLGFDVVDSNKGR